MLFISDSAAEKDLGFWQLCGETQESGKGKCYGVVMLESGKGKSYKMVRETQESGKRICYSLGQR